jgi:malate synthase
MASSSGVSIRGRSSGAPYDRVLTPEAVEFVAQLARSYGPRVDELLARRRVVQVRRRSFFLFFFEMFLLFSSHLFPFSPLSDSNSHFQKQANFDAGKLPHFLPSTAHVRTGDWKVSPLPNDIQDRRVEITGPVDRKMVINALNSGAQVFMADFEDSNAPSWRNQVEGQANLADAVRRTISFEDPKSGKKYALKPSPAVLFVRPRGWHLPEAHFVVDGKPVPGALFDFGMYFFHNARELVARGTGPYFYLPKMQSHLEARLWNEVFLDAQHSLGIPSGTIKATCLIETLPGEESFWFGKREEREEKREEERGGARE